MVLIHGHAMYPEQVFWSERKAHQYMQHPLLFLRACHLAGIKKLKTGRMCLFQFASLAQSGNTVIRKYRLDQPRFRTPPPEINPYALTGQNHNSARTNNLVLYNPATRLERRIPDNRDSQSQSTFTSHHYRWVLICPFTPPRSHQTCLTPSSSGLC